MKRALLLFALFLVCGLPAKAAISFVRVAHAQSIAASSTLAITMTVTAGDCIVVAVDYDNGSTPPTSITDDGASGGNTYTLRTHATQNHDESIWSTAANGTVSATTITITFPTSTAIARIAVAVDYSGVQSIGGTHTATSAGSATLSDSLTTLGANNFVVTGFLQTGSDTFTASAGNLRDQLNGGAGFACVALNDNTAALASSVTNTVTSTTTGQWAAATLELRSTGGAAAPRKPPVVI